MSHKTILTVDGESRHLLTYHHNYFRQKQKMKSFDMKSFFNTPIACDLRNAYHSDDFEHFSEPPQHILGGMFYVSFESTDNDELFYHWMKGSEVLNGSIEFYNTLDEDDIPFQRIEFWDAFLVSIKEQTTQGAYPMIMECDISAAIVRHNRNDATLHRKSWYFTDIDRKPVEMYVADEDEDDEAVEPECTLYFRRPKNYKGEFGFDWLRSEDTGEHGDTWYKNIMTGGVQAYDNFIAENYTCFTQEWKKQHPDYNKNYMYTVPWLTLMPGKTAELRLKLEVEKPAEKIELRFANADDKQYLSLGLNEIPADKTGNYYHTKNLTITCNKQFNHNINLNAYAGDTLVGRFIVLKNDIVKKVDVAVIKVTTGTAIEKYNPPTRKMMEHFKYYLNQLYIEPNFIDGELNLTQTPVQMGWDMKEVHNRGARNPHKEIFIKGTKKQDYLKIKEGDERRTLIDLLYKNVREKETIRTSHPNGEGFYESFHHFLNHMFYQQHPGMDELYQHAYKLYYFAEKGMSQSSDINGQAHFDTKAAAIFTTGYNDDSPAHELLHCFSLNHTFYENRTDRRNSKHLLNKYYTDNIMDYKQETAPTRVSIWYWQMQQIWQHLKMK